MANTTNFNWETPDDTDLVKDGALAIRTLGSSIDTSFVDLKGGTTGQVLSKASNTDLDYTWVTTDDANAIQNAIVDAKGDLIAASAADTPARLAVGNNGETLVADSAATTGLRWQGNYAAGKNKIINGDFDIWQRGTSVSLTNSTYGYGADRFVAYVAFSAGSSSWSQQSFTAGTAPAAGYESQYFGRITCGSTSTYTEFGQRIEGVRTFAGQTVTFSFWAKSSASLTFTPYIFQSYGSGGSAQTAVSGSNITLTSSWTRYSVTLAVPSISGKTIGAGNYIFPSLLHASGTLNSATIDLWGWQVEAGSVATAFQTATGTLQGELAACQRYYFRFTANTDQLLANYAFASSTTFANAQVQFPVPMRVAPTSLDTATLKFVNYAGSSFAMTSVAANETCATATQIYGTVSGVTAGHAGKVMGNGTGSYIGLSAEL
jgi:hypothetical protein